MNTFEKIYAAVCQIPRGSVMTYGGIAALAGNPRMARVVGYALHQNPMPGVIPCHRVVNREGRLAPAFAFGGEEVQRALLEQEGVPFLPDRRVDMSQALFIPQKRSH
jgi:methylated-DNA-protein-cysteine methyltransferase-like protein